MKRIFFKRRRARGLGVAGLLFAALTCQVAYAQFVPPLGLSTQTRVGGPLGQRLMDPSADMARNMRDPKFRGSVTVEAASPMLTLKSVFAAYGATVWYDINSGLNFSTNAAGKLFTFFTNTGYVLIQDVTGAAQLKLQAAGQSIAAALYQDTSGGVYLAPGNANGSASIYSNGTGTVNLRGNHVKLFSNWPAGGTTNGSVLDFISPNDTAGTDPSSIWRDTYKNFYISAQTTGSWIFLVPGTGGRVSAGGILRNTGMPTTNPSTGAHFVCVNDAGDLYRSETTCK